TAGAADVWHHASEERAASISEGDAAEPEAGAAIAPVEEPGTGSEAHGEPSALPPRATEELVSPWEQPEAGTGSAALETPRFELRSAPVEEIATAAPETLASSLDVAHETGAPVESGAD